LREADSHFSELIKLTKANFSAEKSMILTCRLNTQAGYYLPDYLVYCPFPLIFSRLELPIEAQNVYITYQRQTNPKRFWIPNNFKIEPISVPDEVNTLILLEEEIAQYYHNPGRPLQEIESNLNSTKIYFLRLRPDDRIFYDYHYLSVG
jgi:hypothetical protein